MCDTSSLLPVSLPPHPTSTQITAPNQREPPSHLCRRLLTPCILDLGWIPYISGFSARRQVAHTWARKLLRNGMRPVEVCCEVVEVLALVRGQGGGLRRIAMFRTVLNARCVVLGVLALVACTPESEDRDRDGNVGSEDLAATAIDNVERALRGTHRAGSF